MKAKFILMPLIPFLLFHFCRNIDLDIPTEAKITEDQPVIAGSIQTNELLPNTEAISEPNKPDQPILKEQPIVESSPIEVVANSQPVEPTQQPDMKETIQTINTMISKTKEEGKTEPQLDKKNSPTMIIIICLISLLTFCLATLSVYYRVHLQNKRKALFDAPEWLNCLFPKPINYETEISVLCSKYMGNVN